MESVIPKELKKDWIQCHEEVKTAFQKLTEKLKPGYPSVRAYTNDGKEQEAYDLILYPNGVCAMSTQYVQEKDAKYIGIYFIMEDKIQVNFIKYHETDCYSYNQYENKGIVIHEAFYILGHKMIKKGEKGCVMTCS